MTETITLDRCSANAFGYKSKLAYKKVYIGENGKMMQKKKMRKDGQMLKCTNEHSHKANHQLASLAECSHSMPEHSQRSQVGSYYIKGCNKFSTKQLWMGQAMAMG